MSEVLVLIDHGPGGPRKVSLQMLTAARRIAGTTGETVAGVWLGPDAAGYAGVLGRHGARRLYVWDAPDANAYVTLPRVEALEQVLRQTDASALLFASTNHTKDVAARLAIRTGAGVITDVSGVEADGGRLVATKEVFGGETITRSQVTGDRLQLIGVSTNAFAAEEADAAGPEVVGLDVELSEQARAAQVTEVVSQTTAERPDIGEAAIVVAGGRGLGKEEGFALLEELADELGAGVGASRAATDAGWYPHRYQIGQTGRTISPQLYIGCGISGAIQHRAGMQTAQYIVPINTDPEAPLFKIADLGVVGDIYDVVPKLIEEIRRRRE